MYIYPEHKQYCLHSSGELSPLSVKVFLPFWSEIINTTRGKYTTVIAVLDLGSVQQLSHSYYFFHDFYTCCVIIVCRLRLVT